MSTTNRPEIGSLSTEAGYRTGGRKMDTWKFQPSAPDKATKIGIVFDVFLDKNKNGIVFRVETADIPKERWTPLTGTDIADLRKQAEDIVQREFHMQLGLTWSTWLEVQVSEPYGGKFAAESGLTLSYRAIPRADNAQGQAYTVDNGRLVRFPTDNQVVPKEERHGTFGVRPGEDGSLKSVLNKPSDNRSANSQFTYLPDTPENRQGLQAIVDAIEQVGRRLQAFLGKDTIALTLQRAAAFPQTALLAGPTAEQEEGGEPRRRAKGP